MKILIGVVAEDLLPCSLGIDGLVQRVEYLGLEQFRRHGSVKQPLGDRGVIPHAAPGSGLVLHLDQQHRMLRVGFLQMPHHRREYLRVGFHRCLSVRRRRIDRLSIAADDVGILSGIVLHPLGHVVVASVLPGAEPQQHQMHLVLPPFLEQRVNQRKIEHPRLRLDLLPVNRNFDGVGVQRLYRRPHLRQHARPGAGVMHLSS